MAERTLRPSRGRKPYVTATQNALPLDLADELRALLPIYEDCPGITRDLLALLASIERRAP
jgi:hypothetical protein